MFSSSKICILFSLVISSLLASIVMGWTANTPSSHHQEASSRRAFLDTAAKVVPLVALSAPAFADDEVPASAEPETASPAPAASEENEFIARLKKQSDANKEKYQQQATRSDKLSSAQFSSQYNRPSYVGIRRFNGSYEMVLPNELDELIKSGKVELTYDMVIIDKKTGEMKEDYSKKIYAYK